MNNRADIQGLVGSADDPSGLPVPHGQLSSICLVALGASVRGGTYVLAGRGSLEIFERNGTSELHGQLSPFLFFGIVTRW